MTVIGSVAVRTDDHRLIVFSDGAAMAFLELVDVAAMAIETDAFAVETDCMVTTAVRRQNL